MVTRDAAKAIGLADKLGSLEVGKQADIAIIDFEYPHLTPAPDPIHALVYGLQGFEVETVFCAGDIIMEERAILTSDETLPDTIATATDTAADIVTRANIS